LPAKIKARARSRLGTNCRATKSKSTRSFLALTSRS
jgi:hypothetical protein